LTAGPLECLPERCGCGYRFVGGEERVGEPVAHQQWELPLVVPDVREWRRLRLVCPCCGKPVVAELPAGVSLSPFGPRLHAHVAVLAGVCRLSREKITELLLDAYGITVSVGAVDTMIRLSGRSSSWPTPSRYGADASGAGAPRFGLRTLRARRQSGLA